MVSRILRPKLSDGQMHIEAKKDGMILLCGQDQTMSMSAVIHAEVENGGAYKADGHLLAEYVSKLPDGTLAVSGEVNSLTFRAGSSRTRIAATTIFGNGRTIFCLLY